MKSFKCNAAILAVAAVVVIGSSVNARATTPPITASPAAAAVTNCSGISPATSCSSNSTAPTPTIMFTFNDQITLTSAPAVANPANGWSVVSTTCDGTGATTYGSGAGQTPSCSATVSFTSPPVAALTFEQASLTFNYLDATSDLGGTETVELDGNPVTGLAAVSLVSTPPANPAANNAAATVSNGAVTGSAYSVTLNSILDSGNGAVPNSGTLRPSSEGFATTGGTCAASTLLSTGSNCNLNFSFTNPPDATGPESLPLTYNFTDSNGYSWSVLAPVQGNPGVASQVSLTSNLLVFNNLSTTIPSGPQSVSLSNNGQNSATVASVIVTQNAGFNQNGGCNSQILGGGGGSCTINITFTDPTIPYGTSTQPAIGPQKATIYILFSDNSFVTATLRGNPSPMSGALLTIGPANGLPTVAVYDSQIHTGTVNAPSAVLSCLSPPTQGAFGDTHFPTDAYVFQGGSWTGCDPSDASEANLTPTNTPDPSITLGGFTISTHYQCGPLFNGACNAAPKCSDTGGTLIIGGTQQADSKICSSDTGFVTVTNNTGSAFSGQIQLSGISQDCGGLITDTFTGLLAGNSVTLALAPDSSFCGGFEAQETLPITASSTTIFPFGNDKYQITPFNSAAGDKVTFMVVPFPDNPVSDLNPKTNIALFDPGPNFPGYRCTPYSDLSGTNNPVCAGLQIGCVPGNTVGSPTGDCETYIYSSELDYTVAPDDAENGGVSSQILNLGAPGFLGVHHENFPPPCDDITGAGCYDLNTLVSYNGDCCVKTTGGRDGSAHIDVWNPNFAPLTTLNIFTGFQTPVADLPSVNLVKSGQAVALKWIQDDTTGQPITNLTLCANISCPSGGTNPPWINVTAYKVRCPSSASDVTDNSVATGSSGLQNLSGTTPGLYQYNWNTPKGLSGTCAQVVFTYNTGVAFVTPALFQFK